MLALGVFGGSFDPIHFGHIALARCLRDTLQLPEVRLIPTGEPPHRAALSAPATVRLAWVQEALAGESGLVADGREVRRDGYSYTSDTLAELSREIPGRLLVWLIGGDSLAGLPRWRHWQALLNVGHLVVAARQHSDYPAEIRAELARRQVPCTPSALAQGRISFLPSPLLPYSATAIRARIAAGLSVTGMTPVADAIAGTAYYRNHHD
ncbi:nicotinate (nicotinamide) nucleotide adenylyltransferase [Chitinibacteraceae bacterium HSL-7]